MNCRACRACLAIVGLTSILASGCERRSNADAQSVRQVVRFAPAQTRKVTDYAFYNGRTAAVESVNIKARVDGYLNSVDFVSGTEVTKGKQLFKIDPRPYQAAYDEVEGQVQLAQARLGLADADLKRANELFKTPGAISQQDIDTRVAAQKEAVAAVAASKANAESAKLNLEFTSIASPIDGVVDRNRITVGNLVTKDSTLLTTVVSQTPMYVYFDVDEYTMLRVEKLIQEGKVPSHERGKAVPVEMGLSDQGDEYPISGNIDFVSNQLDSGTGTIAVRAVFDNPKLTSADAAADSTGSHRLMRPGLFVRIRLPLGPPYTALVVPQAAVGTDQGLKYLLVVNDKGAVEYRPVIQGAEQADGWQVVVPKKMVQTNEGLRPLEAGETTSEPTVDSLRADDRVVVGGLQQVRPGMIVNAKPIPPGEPMAMPATAGPGPSPADLSPPVPTKTEKQH
ncbi:MAG TPA: efflux RND transporter periplasmic adaptor subunit [Pirellulales bacterium]|jgi:multidrug efflux system membrane fusion protein|nr:efflux RND transporter periplasmic adaptor subunit [Pirellulales bacterium]